MPYIHDTPPPSPPPALQRQYEEAFRLRHEHHSADVVIVGAGVIGCALAVAFAKQGRSVILLEKSLKEPDRIVGELLQPGGVDALTELGLRDCLEDIDAIPVHGYAIFYHGQPVEIPYPHNVASPKTNIAQERIGSKKAQEEQLPPQGRSFHHGRFIAALRRACAREPNISMFETTATNPIYSTALPDTVLGVSASTHGKPDFFFAPLTIAADGYSSAFRKVLHPDKPTSRSKFYALELKDCDLPYSNHGHVILGDMAPILLYQIGTHETRILVDVPEKCASATPAAGGVKNHFSTVVKQNLPESTLPSFEAAMKDFKPRSMPNSWLPPTTQGRKMQGFVLLGDAMNMRHPLTGGGMTVALNDVVLLRNLTEDISDLGDHKRMNKVWKQFHWQRKGLTSVINILAMALYSLFAANDSQLRALQRGCFRYFQYGGKCVDEPVSLLAGIIRQPLVLVYHFFAVALVAIWMSLSASPLWRLPLYPLDAGAIFWKACVVIFPFIFSELKT